jgi:hypothetical protein
LVSVFTASGRLAPVMFHATQWVYVPDGASGSSTMRA